MKLNLEVEIDWIDEEQGIDEVVKESIISSIVRTVGDKVRDEIAKDAEKTLKESIATQVNEKINQMFDDFSNQPVTVRDSYGDITAQHESVRHMMKDRFDRFLTETVDEKGNSHSGYGRKMTRTEYLMQEQINKFAKEFTDTTVKAVTAEMKKTVSEGLTQRLGAELMTVLKVNEMIGLPEGRK